MAKASVSKKYSVTATGILNIDENGVVGVEIEETGEFVSLKDLFSDFVDKDVNISCNYKEDY